MNEPRDPSDPGAPDDKPPGQPMVLGADELPEHVREAIEQAINDRHIPSLVDHAFLIEQARITGLDVKRLRKLYPQLPKWVREELLKRRVTVDAWGDVRRLH